MHTCALFTVRVVIVFMHGTIEQIGNLGMDATATHVAVLRHADLAAPVISDGLSISIGRSAN
jgi:hypothetical protein